MGSFKWFIVENLDVWKKLPNYDNFKATHKKHKHVFIKWKNSKKIEKKTNKLLQFTLDIPYNESHLKF